MYNTRSRSRSRSRNSRSRSRSRSRNSKSKTMTARSFVSKTPICKANGCSNMRGEETVKTFFRFPHPQKSPLDRALCQRWLDNLKNETLPQNVDDYKWKTLDVVCQDHFSPGYFKAPGSSFVRLSLKRGAVPTEVDMCRADPSVSTATSDCDGGLDQLTVQTAVDCEPHLSNEPFLQSLHSDCGCGDMSSSSSPCLIRTQNPEASIEPMPEEPLDELHETGQSQPQSPTAGPCGLPEPPLRVHLGTDGDEQPPADVAELSQCEAHFEVETGGNVSEPEVVMDVEMDVEDAEGSAVCGIKVIPTSILSGQQCADMYDSSDRGYIDNDESDEDQPADVSWQESGSESESGCVCEGQSLASASSEPPASPPMTSLLEGTHSRSNDFIGRLAQLQAKKGKTRNGLLTKGEKAVEELMSAEIKKAKLESKKLQVEIELLKLKATNARLEQLTRYYKLRKVEQEMGMVPSMIDLNITVPEIIFVTRTDPSVTDNP